TGSRRSTLGLRYRSQSTSRLVNLSAPATIGTSPYPIRNSVFASDGMLVPPNRKVATARPLGKPRSEQALYCFAREDSSPGPCNQDRGRSCKLQQGRSSDSSALARAPKACE